MCGRYTLYDTDELAGRFDVPDISDDLRSNYNVTPSQIMPVISLGEDGKRQVELMRWGVQRMIGKDNLKELINTRSDKAFGNFWKKAVLNRRCLIPANGFYEWQTSKDGKTPYFIHPKDVDLYAFAGIWDTWKDDKGKEIKTYSILTTEPNHEMKEIHKRMPVMLHQKDESSWLESSAEEQQTLEKLLFPSKEGRLEIFEVGRDVNNPRNNYKELLQPV